MKIAMFDTHKFEKEIFELANKKSNHEITYFETRLTSQTAALASGFRCACCFVDDVLDERNLKHLSDEKVKLIALRSAGFNQVNLKAADRLGITIVRVPSYSPHSVAEYAVGLLLSLNRKIHKAYARIQEQNFSLEGLVGTNLFGKTIGIIGTGKIGSVFATIMYGFGCKVIAYDPNPNAVLIKQKILNYVTLAEIYKMSDVISLHLPLMPKTKHIIDAEALASMKKGLVLINTGRGALIDSAALIAALKSGHLSGAALDVYEEEEGIFFRDLSDQVLKDDVLVRLMAFPNVLITSHQAFLTHESLNKIAEVTLQNVTDFELKRKLKNQVHAETHMAASKIRNQFNRNKKLTKNEDSQNGKISVR
jgi:D-lactate dehydrogenase